MTPTLIHYPNPYTLPLTLPPRPPDTCSMTSPPTAWPSCPCPRPSTPPATTTSCSNPQPFGRHYKPAGRDTCWCFSRTRCCSRGAGGLGTSFGSPTWGRRGLWGRMRAAVRVRFGRAGLGGVLGSPFFVSTFQLHSTTHPTKPNPSNNPHPITNNIQPTLQIQPIQNQPTQQHPTHPPTLTLTRVVACLPPPLPPAAGRGQRGPVPEERGGDAGGGGQVQEVGKIGVIVWWWGG